MPENSPEKHATEQTHYPLVDEVMAAGFLAVIAVVAMPLLFEAVFFLSSYDLFLGACYTFEH